jgi:hypothetical protein
MRRNAQTDLSGGVYADEMQVKAPDWGFLVPMCIGGDCPYRDSLSGKGDSAARVRVILLRSQFCAA